MLCYPGECWWGGLGGGGFGWYKPNGVYFPTSISFIRCLYEACRSRFIFTAYAQKCKAGRGFWWAREELNGGCGAIPICLQWYKQSPLSEFGFCEWNPANLFCSGRRSVNAARGKALSLSPSLRLCSTRRFKCICKWACFFILNKRRCAEVRHFRMARWGHYVTVTWSIAWG